MTTIRWSPRSGEDLENIFAHIHNEAPPYAALVVQRIIAAVERLEKFPESGRVVPERNVESLREIIVRPYRVVYRAAPDLVEIVTVFHAAQRSPVFS